MLPNGDVRPDPEKGGRADFAADGVQESGAKTAERPAEVLAALPDPAQDQEVLAADSDPRVRAVYRTHSREALCESEFLTRQ